MNSLKCTQLYYGERDSLLLKNVHFSFYSGDIICLLGNNGSGKSTLLKVCAGIINPTMGCISLNNLSLSSLAEQEKAKLIGWLPQSLNRPYNMTVGDFMNLTTAHLDLEKMNQFDLTYFKNKELSVLSGGEWKRTQLARLWQTKYKLMLLDEPDAELDLRHKMNLVQFCKDYALQNNSIIFIATHDINFVRDVATKIVALTDEGYLVWESDSSEFWETKVIDKIFSTKVVY